MKGVELSRVELGCVELSRVELCCIELSCVVGGGARLTFVMVAQLGEDVQLVQALALHLEHDRAEALLRHAERDVVLLLHDALCASTAPLSGGASKVPRAGGETTAGRARVPW